MQGEDFGPIRQLRQTFAAADPRFGPVPLWWWSGEPVTEERIRWQLQKLRAAGLRNLCVINLAPAGPTHGCSADEPRFYDEAWWDLFGCALGEAERLGMFLWYYDQIGFSGANFPGRLVSERPEFAGYQIRHFPPGEPVPQEAAVVASRDGHRYATVRQGFDWLNPNAAGALLDRIHGEMERRFGDRLGSVIAGSFQDELQPMPTWTDAVPGLYRGRYGEDLLDRLPTLFHGGAGAGELRRRFYGLLAELAETTFFRPLGQWHDRHGMLLGCDQAGPGRKVDPHGAQRLYLDYFRTHRHFSAPGCDMDGEAKPHSSLVHTHGGSRVWLEGFHSSGWGGTVEETLHWLVPWLQAGVTLFDPHAIYYSTRGGWWEWAPPDTGWRQPYAEHYPIFANTVARACWLLAQGHHLCDIAVYYPGHAIWEHMSPADLQAGEHSQAAARRDPDADVHRIRDVYWALVGRQSRHEAEEGILRAARRDFDVVDDAGMAAGQVDSGALAVAAERYRIVILPGVDTPEPEVRKRLEAFVAGGGLLLAVGFPDDAPLPTGAVRIAKAADVPEALGDAVPRRAEGPGLGLARRVNDLDVFLLLPPTGTLLPMHAASEGTPSVPAEATYSLLTAGIPELWDPVSGTQRPLPCTREGGRVVVQVPFVDWPAALVVCRPQGAAGAAPGEPDGLAVTGGVQPARADWPESRARHVVRDVPPSTWHVRVESTLDNRFGDFDLNGSHAFLPVERRLFRVNTECGAGDGEGSGWHLPTFDDREWPQRLWSEGTRWLVGHGDRFSREQATPAVYSTVFGDLAFRDWAGRMGRVPRTFLDLGKARAGETVWAFTHVLAPRAGTYWLQVEGSAVKAAAVGGIDIRFGGMDAAHAVGSQVTLGEGPNELLLRCTAVRDGKVRVGVNVSCREQEAQPEWVTMAQPAAGPEWALRYEVVAPTPVRKVRLSFAAHGCVELLVNGRRVAVEGDFNPYVRQGQQELDVTAFWRVGANELRLSFPERGGYERALLDGEMVFSDGQRACFATGPEWLDGEGRPASRIAHAGSTEALWIRARPHPLVDVGWLMPDSAPSPAPLPFLLNPDGARRPVWLRFELPVGARGLRVAALGSTQAWVGGSEVEVRDGSAEFKPQSAGTQCALRVVPNVPAPEAAVLLEPVRFRLSVVDGDLGDWRTVLHLPHHSGVVEYEAAVMGTGTRAWLDLGYVRGTAQVWVDGRDAGVRLWHPYCFDLQDRWGPGPHRLRIRITNTLGAHYEIGRPTSLVGKGQAASGLFGPVRIAEGLS